MKRIEIGDIVVVNFNASAMTLSHQCKVLHRPEYPGDTWVFEELQGDSHRNKGSIYETNEPCTLTFLAKNLEDLNNF